MYLVKRGNVLYIEYHDAKTKKTRRVSTGKKDRAEATEYMRSFRSLQVIPSVKEVQTSQETGSKTVDGFQERYINYVKAMFSKAYVEIVKQSIKQMRKSIRANYLRDISFELADRFIVSTYSTAPFAASQYLRTLKAAFTRAVDWGLLKKNPFTKVKIPRLPRLLPVFISQAEFQLILDKTETRDLRDIFTTAFHTGMRRGEFLNLKWESVDLAGKLLKVECSQGFSTKGRKDRIIPLNKTMMELLVRRASNFSGKPSRLVFPTAKELAYNGEFVGKKFKKAVRAAGLNPKVHLHSLRHSFASNLVQKDVPILVVKELLGHEKLSTTQIYSHVKHDNLAEAVKKLE